MTFPVFINFHDFLRFCSYSWLSLLLFISWLFEILFISWLFEILFIFMTFWDLSCPWLLRFCSCPWLFEILFIFHDFFEIFFSWRCGTEGENLKERDFFKCFFLNDSNQFKWWLNVKFHLYLYTKQGWQWRKVNKTCLLNKIHLSWWQDKIKSKSNQLLLSHHHSTSALVSEILESVLQTVQKNKTILHTDSTYLQTVQKTMCKIHIHILNTHSVL